MSSSTQTIPNCKCNEPSIQLTVKKDGPNKGRKFYKCKTSACNFFSWVGYNPGRFKNGACYRCGRWGCDLVDCEETTDFYGNLIPEDYDKYF